MPPKKKLAQVKTALKRWLRQEHRVWLTGAGVAGCVLLLRLAGILQSLEWAALDQLFRLRPLEVADERVVIVGIDDTDISQVKTWPIPDAVMAQLLSQLRSYQPRAIGLDIYRDLPVKPGHDALQKVFQTTPNLIGIEKIADEGEGVPPPARLAQQGQVGFNNVVVDADNRVRRAMLFWTLNGEHHTSFSLALALMYLKAEDIHPQPAAINSDYMQLGESVFRPFRSYDGGYVRSNSGGYQVLANFRHSSANFRIVSMTDVLAGRVEPQVFRDRIVLVGSTAASLKDFFYTPLSGRLVGSAQPMAGVELHANFISQILGAALEGRSLTRTLSEPLELLWILGWSWVGAILSWKTRSPGRSTLTLLLAMGGLAGLCYLVFLLGWWIPLVPPMLALAGSTVAISTYLAHLEEELKKSKEFLSSVINSIPDPIFVKNRDHQWIVLNDAYCRFIGRPLNMLLEKSDYDFFPESQAATFWKQDNLIFSSGIEQESEEEFTDANGVTYMIATKRSLHKDGAGNLFLVGVIRDITHRKRMEEELRRTAADLVRSNAELRQAEDRLRHMAYHDTLTGLPNRKLMQDRLSQSLEWAQDHGQLVALLFLDLDGFKQINDSFGHMMGDLLLKAVAQRLTGCLRGSDTVARLGGDEFVVLLPAVPNVQTVAKVADKILSTLSQNFVLDDKTISVTTSIGISIYPLDSQEIESLMTRADMAMYQAKELGKNRCEFFQSEELTSN